MCVYIYITGAFRDDDEAVALFIIIIIYIYMYAFGDDDEAVSVLIDDITDSNAELVNIKRRLGDQADVHVAELIAFLFWSFFPIFFHYL